MSAVPRLMRAHAVALVAAVYLAIGLACCAMLFPQLPLESVLGLVGSLLIGGLLPGTALVRLLFPHASLAHYFAVGTTIGLGLWSIGGLLSHDTGLTFVRWVPGIAGLVLWAAVWERRGRVSSAAGSIPAIGLVGAVVALAGMIPALRVALQSQPLHWVGWYRFYTDLPFHIAITSEVAVRAPEQASWVAGTPLNYTWLFHSAMGVWASLTGATPASVVLQLWPVLFVALIPMLIAVVAWEITGNRWASAASPIVFVFLHGPVFVPGSFAQSPLFQLSPTRDFADLFVLVAVLCIARLIGTRHEGVAQDRVWWAVALAISVLVATGAKGSALPILLGAVGCAGLYLLVTRKLRRIDLISFGVFAVAGVVSYFSVLPAPGLTNALTLQPLSFLPPATIHRVPTSLEILVILSLAVVGVFVVIGRSAPDRWPVAFVLGGLLFAGLFGLAFTNYPGDSELYFWESAQAVFAIALAWSGALLVAHYRWRFAVTMSVSGLVGGGLWVFTQRVWLAELAVGVLALAAAIYFERASRFSQPESKPRSRASSLVVVLAYAAVLVQCAQFVSIPPGTPGGWSSKSSDPSAISHSQLEAFAFIRTHSSVDDVVMTNKHCLSGTPKDSCDPGGLQ